ncbi:MAG: hypothetical protein P1V20_14990 [Verrucomicrobiales bacterium]|nr:hypothetical protein [Verrucomicrobiales bacterium]
MRTEYTTVAETTFSLLEHVDKVGFLVSIMLPVSLLMLVFFGLGLWYSRLKYCALFAEEKQAGEADAKLHENVLSDSEDCHQLLAMATEKLSRVGDTLRRREKHIIELHRRLPLALASQRAADASAHAERVAELEEKIEKCNRREDSLQRLLGEREETIKQLIYEKNLLQSDAREEVASGSAFHHLVPTKNEQDYESGTERKQSLQAIVNLHQSRKERGSENEVAVAAEGRNSVSGVNGCEPRDKLVPVSPQPSGVDKKPESPASEDENVMQEGRFGVIYSMAPGDRDDLKKIKGVGEAVEARLNQIGVYRFKQIALWTDPVANKFVEVLPFGERLVRERWIEQARQLHETSYGESISEHIRDQHACQGLQ